MDIEEYMNTYRTMELSEAILVCEEHGVSFDEYCAEYPSSGLNGWIDVRQFFGWLGYYQL
jgi:hypothetical protein